MSEDRILEKLGEINVALARIEANQNAQQAQCNEHHATLYGHDSEPGLSKEVDRLNQIEKTRAVWYGATVAVVVERMWSWIVHKGSGG